VLRAHEPYAEAVRENSAPAALEIRPFRESDRTQADELARRYLPGSSFVAASSTTLGSSS
jgi:hypothetical protein